MLLAVLLVTLAACGGGEATETTNGTAPAASQSIEGPPWRLTEARGLEVPEALSLTIQFQDGEVSGQSACNRFSGGYEIDGNSLTISELALTRKACNERLTAVDTVLVRTLRRVAAYSFDGPRLQLLNPNERVVLTYRPFGADDLRGRWQVIGLLNRNKEAFATPIEGTTITANFRRGRPVAGERRLQRLLGQLRGAGEHHHHRRRRSHPEDVRGAQGNDEPRKPVPSGAQPGGDLRGRGEEPGVLRRRGHPPGLLPPGRLTALPTPPSTGSLPPSCDTHDDLIRQSLGLTCDHLVTYAVSVTDDDRVFRALADPTRRFLLDRLFVRDGRTLTELESELEMTRFGVMKHLRLLEEAGLVVTRRSGREKLHFLNPVPIRLIHDRWIDKYTERQVSALADLKSELEGSA